MAYVDPGMKKVTQIALLVKDIEAARHQWAAVLGVEPPKVIETNPGSEVQMVYRGKPSNSHAKLAFFHLGQVAIELIEPIGPNTSWYESLEKNGPGVHHIAFNIEDKDKSIAAAAEAGIPVYHSGRFGGNNGTYLYLDSEDKLGVTIELLHNDPK